MWLGACVGCDRWAGRRHARIQDLTEKMVGTREDPVLKLHGAEMTGFLYFCGYLLERFGAQLGDRAVHFRMAQKSFAEMTDMIRENPVKMAPADCARFVDCGRDALRAMENLNIEFRPKMHAMVHMLQDVFEKGSPALWATWVDEGLNHTLKDVGAGSHRSGWYERTLHSMNRVLDRKSRRLQ